LPAALVRASSNHALWAACADRVIGEQGAGTGPEGHPTYLWLTHRIQRDLLFEEAARRGVKGWLAPPIAFFSDLPELFGVSEGPIGLLRRRALIARLAAEHGTKIGIDEGSPDGHGIVGALDALFGELLPEGVTPERLEKSLEDIGEDEFARERNAWVVAVYSAYRETLAADELYDPREIHSILADRIAAGGLPGAIGGAGRLHIYGVTSLRSRRKFVDALAAQSEVEVTLYVPPATEGGNDEFECAEELEGEAPGEPLVQPAPDGRRELDWVAARIKRLLIDESVDPHTIAVVARTGREDARRACEILSGAGIPATARNRRPLIEVPALKAILHLFRGGATNWRYRPLRCVLESAYFDLDIDLLHIDYLAEERRLETLDDWVAGLRQLRDEAERQEAEAGSEGRDRGALARYGIFFDRLRDQCDEFGRFRTTVGRFRYAQPLSSWIDETIDLLDPGTTFGFRERVCAIDGADERYYEFVRLDQQAVEMLAKLLEQWKGIGPDEQLEPADWYVRLRRFLESNEIAISTPLQTGVRILEAHEAALYPFAHTFLVHANDGEFPRRAAPGPIFSDDERAELNRRGIPVAYGELTLDRERALWRAVTASRNVCITYRTADADGKPLLPSLLVPPHDEKDEIPRTEFLPEVPLTESHAHRGAAGRLLTAMQSGTGAPVAVKNVVVVKQAVLNAVAERERRGGNGREPGALGPWNGELRDPVVLDRLAKRFHPDYRWSASALETYGDCPFVFLLKKVLFCEGQEEAEEETTAREQGSVMHDILDSYMSEYIGGALPPAFDADAQAAFEHIAADVLRDWRARQERGEVWLGHEALWAVARRQILEDLRAYLSVELTYMTRNGERPFACEYEFGFDDSEHPAVYLAGADLQGAERRIRVCGMIDRVDEVGAGEAVRYRISDYKRSSAPTGKGYRDGSAVQIPLYMEALRTILKKHVELGVYRKLRKPGKTKPSTSGVVDYDSDDYRSALRFVFSIPERVHAGKFEAKKAAGSDWSDWEPGPEVRRVDASYEEGGCRFDE